MTTDNKTSVVKSIKENHRQWQAPDKVVKYIHYLVFENGDEGEYFSSSPQCFEFQINQLCSYSIEQKGFRGGKPECRIKPKGNGNANRPHQRASSDTGGTPRPAFNNNGPGKPQRNENAIMSQHAITKSIELFAAGGIKINELYPKALEILQWTHKYGKMTVEEILALPIEKVKPDSKKGGKTGKVELF